MHVIAGRFKGMPLPTPASGTRPTTDRTKEAVFSWLVSRDVVEGRRVLDLFAGTGALGIEALSRGAIELVAVDSSAAAVAGLSKAVRALANRRGVVDPPPTRVVRARAERFVASCHVSFGLVVVDPPYALGTHACSDLLDVLFSRGVVEDGGLVVLERSVRDEEPHPEGTGGGRSWRIAERRDYGETAVYYCEAEDDADTADDGDTDDSDAAVSVPA
ncbi:RsmD family RNA methyltransferase [uncultured Bifidobacterium sp.]|uniref:RsmD family RNA methyltransferase n=1 Tax=uncultured Bifidobacterium sp. TaxID=165187 RepID=UPI0028DBBA98|nr:RsmD family RNA methyltransferase [uncultured Bifidobacterium sp.]